MSQKCPKLTKRQRRRRVVELRAQGYTLQHIADALKVNEKTIDRDLKSVDVKIVVDELIRRQLDDMEHEEKGYVRLQFRDKLLEKLMPRKVEQQVTGEMKQKLEVDKPVITVEDLIGEYGDVILDEVMERRLQRDRGDAEEGSGESVDPTPPNP